MADLEFFFDPVCPFAWITSRWVDEARALRHYQVTWRFISLAIVNEDVVAEWYTPDYRASHVSGMQTLRVIDAVRLIEGNEGVDRLYTAVGTEFHPGGRRPAMTADPVGFMAKVLAEAGFDPALAAEVDNAEHDAHLRAETAAALDRTGKDVGTPILTFHPGTDREGSFFGPVISSIPRGQDALRLWDAVEVIATTSGVAELKRSNRAPLNFS